MIQTAWQEYRSIKHEPLPLEKLQLQKHREAGETWSHSFNIFSSYMFATARTRIRAFTFCKLPCEIYYGIYRKLGTASKVGWRCVRTCSKSCSHNSESGQSSRRLSSSADITSYETRKTCVDIYVGRNNVKIQGTVMTGMTEEGIYVSCHILSSFLRSFYSLFSLLAVSCYMMASEAFCRREGRNEEDSNIPFWWNKPGYISFLSPKLIYVLPSLRRFEKTGRVGRVLNKEGISERCKGYRDSSCTLLSFHI